jgi:transposase
MTMIRTTVHLLNHAVFANFVSSMLDSDDIDAIAERAAHRVGQLFDRPERAAQELADELADRLAGQVADRVAARLEGASRDHRKGLIDAQEVARRTGRTREWVYDHQGELGAIRLGSGPKPRLGFDPARVLALMERVDDPTPLTTPPVAKPRRRRQRAGRTATGAELLRVRGHES